MKHYPLLLHPKLAQEFLGVKATKFYELLQLSGFPKPRSPLGKRSMFLRDELEAWVNSLDQ